MNEILWRCERTGNPVGTDTVMIGAPVCVCRGCRGARLKAENTRLRIAFHDAIRRPLGVTPGSGEEFYDPRMAREAEERRAAGHVAPGR